MKYLLIIICTFILTLSPIPFSFAQNTPENSKLAIQSAESWLKLVDNGKDKQSWKDTAQFFQKFVSEKQWKKTIDTIRSTFGKVISRKVKSHKYETSLPGVPDGQYYVITFQSSFENKKNAIETVTPMLDKDGKWHVAGYYIK